MACSCVLLSAAVSLLLHLPLELVVWMLNNIRKVIYFSYTIINDEIVDDYVLSKVLSMFNWNNKVAVNDTLKCSTKSLDYSTCVFVNVMPVGYKSQSYWKKNYSKIFFNYSGPAVWGKMPLLYSATNDYCSSHTVFIHLFFF